MIHSQPPESMKLNQGFPARIEVELLGANKDTAERTTANICTPNSHVEIDKELVEIHCVNSSSKTYPGKQWVAIEIEVQGDEVIKHRINGELVFEYSNPLLDEKSQHLTQFYGGAEMKSGYIAIQAENSTVQFKSIELNALSQ